MLSSMRNMFKVPDLRNKILFTLLMLALYRLGAHVPVPGIDVGALKDLQEQAENGGVLGFLQLFSGGAITQFAVFALGIMPYITASIIMQILAVVIPKLEQWQQQGAVGQRKITQWTPRGERSRAGSVRRRRSALNPWLSRGRSTVVGVRRSGRPAPFSRDTGVMARRR